ncbi:MAG: zinc finger CCCH domain-containing protein [Chthoniobacter sp.]|nr:zinc finger CCCH domain-containing protein [Chthoniobacter sp.]
MSDQEGSDAASQASGDEAVPPSSQPSPASPSSSPPASRKRAASKSPPSSAKKKSSKKARHAQKSSRRASQRAAAAQIGSLSEDLDLQKESERIEQSSAFWRKFPAPLLHAWLSDYDGLPEGALTPLDVNDLDRLVTLLVEHRVPMVVEGTRRKLTRGELVAHFKDMYPTREVPGTPSVSAAAARSAESGDSSPDESEGDQESEMEEGVPDQRPVLAPRAVVDLSAPSPTRRRAQPPVCRTCRSPAPDTANVVAHAIIWKCAVCKLRGDLEMTDPINIYLAKIAGQAAEAAAAQPAAAAVQASASSSVSSSSGQSPELSRLDKEFERLAASKPIAPHPPNPAFAPGASTPPTHQEALELVRRCWQGESWERPSEALIKLIRSGMFQHPSWATPRKVGEAPFDAGPAAVTVAGDGSLVQQTRNSLRVPPMHTLVQFCQAFASVIGPALIDLPHALLDWFTLFRTMLAIDAEHGWAAAVTYMLEAMNESVPLGRSFGPLSTQALWSIKFAHPGAGVHLPQNLTLTRGPVGSYPVLNNVDFGRPVTGSAFGKQHANACNDWNRGACTRGEKCKYRHICLNFQRCGAQPGSHTVAQCVLPSPPQPPRGPRRSPVKAPAPAAAAGPSA